MKSHYTSGKPLPPNLKQIPEPKAVKEILEELDEELQVPETIAGDGIRVSHYKACKLEGMTDSEIEADWDVVRVELAQQEEADFERRLAQGE